ncbi:MAG: sugar phosphate isomerase/epimerase [Rhodothermia bacterium]|nr:MAG: sugar phosphate isomerase/epimerase [Rhodothermia bacterium]
MNRRQFVLVAGMGLVSTTLTGSALERAGSTLRSTHRVALKKAVKFGMIQEDMTILQKFELLKRIGFDGVEMDSPSDLDIDEIVAARDTSGLTIPGVVDSVHWRQTLSDADPAVREAGLDGLMTALNDAHAFGASTVLLVPAVVNKDTSYDDAYTRSQLEIRKVLPLASELGVKIAIENVWNRFLLSPLEAARYVDEFESDMVGWHLDIGNIVTFSWPEQWIRILGHRVLKLDIKEYSRAKRDEEGPYAGFRVKLGDGDNNWPEVLNALDDIGYEGWATAEIPGGGTKRLEEIATRMNRILELS